jgi:hypothetical protein
MLSGSVSRVVWGIGREGERERGSEGVRGIRRELVGRKATGVGEWVRKEE